MASEISMPSYEPKVKRNELEKLENRIMSEILSLREEKNQCFVRVEQCNGQEEQGSGDNEEAVNDEVSLKDECRRWGDSRGREIE